jgi:hypothetical protein
MRLSEKELTGESCGIVFGGLCAVVLEAAQQPVSGLLSCEVFCKLVV